MLLQHAREEEIAERKAMKRAERDIARKKEYVRRVRLQIEEKRAEVSLCCQRFCPQIVQKARANSKLCCHAQAPATLLSLRQPDNSCPVPFLESADTAF